jgi:hypothetical protein
MKNLVIITMSVMFLYTSCKGPTPGSDLFGDENWDVFSRAQRADAYALRPEKGGPVAGSATIDSSGRREPQTLHRIWSYLQDHKTYRVGAQPATSPVPEYLVRYGRGKKSVDLVLDVDEGYLSIYETGNHESILWISVEPAKVELANQFDYLFERRPLRDVRPNL